MFNSFNLDFTYQPCDLNTILPMMLALVAFTIYWFTANSAIIKNKFYSKYEFDTASFKHILFTKIFGFVIMGIFPIIICLLFIKDYSLADYGLTVIPATTLFSLAWIAGLSTILIPLVSFSAKKPKNLVNYPQIRSKIWTKKIFYYNALGWFLYLFGYEFLFRGVLLIPLANQLGIWPAIAVNVAMYSATHIPKGLEETLGAIPLGLVLCVLTLMSGTIWIAFLVHVVMAWTNSFTALKHHPDIQYNK